MDFYYCVKIKTLEFSTCGSFRSENEFIWWFWGWFFFAFCYLESFTKIGKLMT